MRGGAALCHRLPTQSNVHGDWVANLEWYRLLQADLAPLEQEITTLLAATEGTC